MPVTLWLLPCCKINWMKEIFEGGAAQGFLLFKGTFPLATVACCLWPSSKFLEKIWIVWDAAQIKLSSTELHGWDCRNDLKEFVDGSIVLAVAWFCEKSDTVMGDTPKSQAKGSRGLPRWRLIPPPLKSKMEFKFIVKTSDCPHFKEQHTLTELKAACVKSALGEGGRKAQTNADIHLLVGSLILSSGPFRLLGRAATWYSMEHGNHNFASLSLPFPLFQTHLFHLICSFHIFFSPSSIWNGSLSS